MEVGEEPWEALDVDDTDLSSSTTTTSLLRRCSHQPPYKTTTRRLIPGPAAAIQAAMHRNNQFQENHPVVISTQEYIRRVDQDAGLEFSRNPWLFALDFLRQNGVVDITPISSVKKSANAERFDKVVAIVKSCAPNGLGDMMITLKDPTDTIGASIHGKALNVGDFGKFITVGSVLILQKVVAFSSCVSCYLNITRSNIDKVISVDCEVQSFPETNLDNNPERTSAQMLRTEGVRNGLQSKGKAVYEDLTQRENCTQYSSFDSSRQIETGANKIFNSGPSKWQGTNSVRNSQPGPGSFDTLFRNLQGELDNNKNFSQDRESWAPLSKEENLSGNQTFNGNNSQVEGLSPHDNFNMSTSEKLKKQEQSKSVSSAPGMIESQAKRDISEIDSISSNVVEQQDDEARGASAIKKQRTGLVSKSAVQEWTDEQLCALDMDEF